MDLSQSTINTVQASVSAFIGRADAEDLCSQLCLELVNGEHPTADLSWLCAEAKNRAKKQSNKLRKDKHRIFSYTESPMNVPGEISSTQLEKLCSRVDLPEVSAENRLIMMKTLFDSLLPSDKQFLTAYETKKAKELVPKYGSSVTAIRQRACRLKKHLMSSLASIYGRK